MNKKCFWLSVVILNCFLNVLADEKESFVQEENPIKSIKKTEPIVVNGSSEATTVIVKIKSWDENISETLEKFYNNETCGWKKLQADLSKIKVFENKQTTKKIGLESILNAIQNFSSQLKKKREDDTAENFYILLLQLSNKLFFVADSESSALRKTLNEWFACSRNQADENEVSFNEILGSKLEYVENKANEYFSISFMLSGPIDLSSSINKSFELAELLMQRLDFIERFKKKTGSSGFNDSSIGNVNIDVQLSEVIAKCLVLQVFERLFMQSEKYEDELRELSSSNFNEMLSGILVGFKQVQEIIESPAINQTVEISQNAYNCLNFILVTLYNGIEPDIVDPTTNSVEVSKNVATKEIVSVKNFLNKLKNISLKITSDQTNQVAMSNLQAVQLFLNTSTPSTQENSNLDINFSLEKFMSILRKLDISEKLNLRN